MAGYTDRFFNSADGVKLHYRDYDGNRDRPPILCIPGLTRNARDFEPVGERYGGQWRVIALDLRGRGLSAADPNPANYRPPTYVGDILKLLDQLGIADAVLFGTSLGGICTMLLAASDHERIAGALINDIGPMVDPRGLERIASYVGQVAAFADWDALAGELKARNADAFPDWSDGQWQRLARRLASERDGSIRADYDPAIANAFFDTQQAPPPDMWPLYRALDGRPVTILRGELSDLLSRDVAQRMASEIADVELVEVPRVGHVPSLDEPASQAAIDRLLDRVLARA